MKAQKLPSGRYRARAYNKFTGSTKSFTADTKKEAERLATAWSFREHYNGKETFEAVANSYILNKTNILSPNTIKDYQTTLKLHTIGINKRRLDSITSSTLQVLVNDLAETKSPKTVKNVYGFITAVIRSRMPSQAFDITLPRKIKQDIEMPSEADIKLILDNAKSSKIECCIKLALMCCMRRGEIAALLEHKECIKDDSVIVKYNQIKDKGVWVCKSPKTYTSYRTIPCPPELVALARQTEPVNSGYITDRWIKYMEKLGMKYRFHDLRHASASLMMSINIPMVDIEKFGGWRHGSSVLQDVYAYNIEESMKRSANLWQGKIRNLSQNVDTKLATKKKKPRKYGV